LKAACSVAILSGLRSTTHLTRTSGTISKIRYWPYWKVIISKTKYLITSRIFGHINRTCRIT
jgi:hypothetical protein